MERSHNGKQNEKHSGKQKRKRFETDTTRIVHRHLADKNHVITDEEVRSVRIFTGLPPFDEVTTGAEAETIRREEQEQPSDRPVTPWDTVE